MSSELDRRLWKVGSQIGTQIPLMNFFESDLCAMSYYARTPLDRIGQSFDSMWKSMAFTSSSLLTSPKFLCKYVQRTPPLPVVCYVHSQLAVQPCKVRNVQICCLFTFAILVYFVPLLLEIHVGTMLLLLTWIL